MTTTQIRREGAARAAKKIRLLDREYRQHRKGPLPGIRSPNPAGRSPSTRRQASIAH